MFYYVIRKLLEVINYGVIIITRNPLLSQTCPSCKERKKLQMIFKVFWAI